jgi:hypothetical protein
MWTVRTVDQACSSTVANVKTPILTNGALAKEIDAFYHDPANERIPIALAVRYVYLQINGADEKDIKELRDTALKVYTDK